MPKPNIKLQLNLKLGKLEMIRSEVKWIRFGRFSDRRHYRWEDEEQNRRPTVGSSAELDYEPNQISFQISPCQALALLNQIADQLRSTACRLQLLSAKDGDERGQPSDLLLR